MPAVCAGLIPIPSFVIIALVAAGTLSSSAANFKTVVKGVLSGTRSTSYGSGILKEALDMVAPVGAETQHPLGGKDFHLCLDCMKFIKIMLSTFPFSQFP